MATVSERARELAEGIVREIPLLPDYFSIMTKALGVSEASVQYEVELADRFEQALLAERRLALTEASKMLVFLEREDASFEGTDDEFWSYAASEGVAQYRKHIRGLIDAPVATPRGGETHD